MVIGYVIRNHIPMFMSFEEDAVESICEELKNSMDMSYKVYTMFADREDENDPWEE